MNSIDPIEGDYIETKNSNLIFDVKGILHPNDFKICYLRFIPHPDGDRIRNDIHYKKVYDLSERHSILKENYPEYLFYSNQLDLEVQGVKTKDIGNIFTPRVFFKNLLQRENKLSDIEHESKDLCNIIINDGNLNEDSIGITGSTMIGLNTKDSDIDIIIYGTENGLKIQQKLENIFETTNNLRQYSLDEYKTHYKWRVGGSDISFEDFLKIEKRKLHQGIYKNREFFIRYIKSPEDWNGNFFDYMFKNIGRIKLKAEIMDSTDAIFTPCSYKIKPLKILEEGEFPKNFNINEIKEISSFRGRFCEQAKNGEKVFVEGKLEGVNFKNTKNYFRILLTDQKKDKMLLLS